MAAASTISLPPFTGAVRRLVLALVISFFASILLHFAAPVFATRVLGLLLLEPSVALPHFFLWQLVTYAFLNGGIIGTLFGLLTLWFTGSTLESSRGSRWFVELFYTVTVMGGLLASLLALLPLWTGGRMSFFGMSPRVATAGLSGPLFGVLVAFAVLFGDVEFLLFFVVRIRAKYLVAIGVLVYMASVVHDRDTFGALLALCCALSGYLFVHFAPRRGVAFVAGERYFAGRNAWFRWKRRRAARKFEVYMRKQNRIVRFDEEGRYIPAEDETDVNSRRPPRVH